LLAGVYDGEVAFGDLMRQGDFGIGTFDALGGEMIALDGHAYDVRFDGRVVPVDPARRTPFAAVLFFDRDRTTPPLSVTNLAQFAAVLDAHLAATNQPCALRLDGVFDYVRTRSVPPQHRPYPPLAEVARSQAVFEFRNVRGTLIGFRCPAWMKGVNVPGYHLHFLTADHIGGGHVLDLAFADVPAGLDTCHRVTVELPRAGDFGAVNLGQDRSRELQQVEK
jgi:acetolactate decarboxylase